MKSFIKRSIVLAAFAVVAATMPATHRPDLRGRVRHCASSARGSHRTRTTACSGRSSVILELPSLALLVAKFRAANADERRRLSWVVAGDRGRHASMVIPRAARHDGAAIRRVRQRASPNPDIRDPADSILAAHPGRHGVRGPRRIKCSKSASSSGRPCSTHSPGTPSSV